MFTHHVGAGDPRRSLELLWSPPTELRSGPGRPAKLTLHEVVEAGITIADDEGLAALSMRGVADVLGVGTMTLYRYVPGKAELLDLMVDAISDIDFPPGVDPVGLTWREAVELLAEQSWKQCLAHPWILAINRSSPVLGPRALTATDRMLSSYRDLDIDDQHRLAILVVVENYVHGSARQLMADQEFGNRVGESEDAVWWPYLDRAMASGDYPAIAELDPEVWHDLLMNAYQTFRLGLAALLDGLEARLVT